MMATADERLTDLEQLTQAVTALIVRHDNIIEEIRQENRMTRRIWIAIAKKQQLFDDDQWRDVFGEDP